MAYVDLYWERVADGVCIECGLFAPKRPGLKRCKDCLRRVSEYNRNRRGKPEGIGRVTYRQQQKVLPDVLEALNKLGVKDDGVDVDSDGAIIGIPVFD